MNLNLYRERDEMLDDLQRLGQALCCYGGDWPLNTCDCKYGATEIRSPTGEATGCPELRSLYMVFAAMTDAEWDDLVTRAGGLKISDLTRHIQEHGLGNSESA